MLRNIVENIDENQNAGYSMMDGFFDRSNYKVGKTLNVGEIWGEEDYPDDVVIVFDDKEKVRVGIAGKTRIVRTLKDGITLLKTSYGIKINLKDEFFLKFLDLTGLSI